MNNGKSLTRQRYERNYRTLRLNGGEPDYDRPHKDWDELEECALLSYDYLYSEFSGWINRQRMFKFHERTEAVATAGSWPF